MRPTVVYLSEAARYAKDESKRIIRRRPRFERTPAAVADEYEDRRSDFAERIRRGGVTVEEYAIGEATEPTRLLTLSTICDGRVSFDIEMVRRRMLDRLLETVRQHRPTTVVEYGAGTGRNLVWLAANLPGVRCVGYELTAGGVEAGNTMADRAGLDVTMHRADFTADGFDPEDADLALTVHALEQVPDVRVARRVIDVMEERSQTVVMVEPFPDYWPAGLAGLAHRVRARRFDRLRPGTLAGRDVVAAELLPFGTTVNRATEVVVRSAR